MQPDPAPQSDVAEIAARLTAARKAMVLALPADGSWGQVPSRAVAKRAWWGMIPGIIEHKHCPEDANEWALNERGLALKSHLQQEATNAE